MEKVEQQLQVINLKQLPIIEERLQSVKESIERRTSAAAALAVTEATRSDVKKIRTEIRAEFAGFESQRMQVKKAIMAPYDAFEKIYKECVTDPYKAADEALAGKIADVESGLKKKKEEDVHAFFTEMAAGLNLEWVKFEQLGLKVTLTSSTKSLKQSIASGVAKVARDCSAIEESPDRDEIMVEYKKSLDLGAACQIVQQRHKQLEAQRRASAIRDEKMAAAKAAEQKVAAEIEQERIVEAPVSVSDPAKVSTPTDQKAHQSDAAAAPAASPKMYVAKFAVTGTIDQLRALKSFLETEGMKYDTIS